MVGPGGCAFTRRLGGRRSLRFRDQTIFAQFLKWYDGGILSYILALDQGTTSSRAILFDGEGAIRSVAQREFEQIFPQPGWVEHDPEQIASSQIAVALEALASARARPQDVAAIGIANQRETTIVWDRKTGRPVCNAIVWQDRRTADVCEQLKAAGHESLIQSRT